MRGRGRPKINDAEVLRIVRQHLATGASLRQCSEALAARGHVTSSGRPYAAEQIRRLQQRVANHG